MVGERVLVTRPEPGASATARRLREAGFEPVACPLSRIVVLADQQWPDLAGIDAVLVTSANALRGAAATRMTPHLGKPCFVVGDRTAAAAASAGFIDVRIADGDASSLAELVRATARPGIRFLYPCGRVRRPDLEASLLQFGHAVSVVETYDVEPLAVADDLRSALSFGTLQAVLLHSVTSAELLLPLRENEPGLAGAPWICLSDRIAAAVRPVHPKTAVATEPSDAAMIALIGRSD